MSRSNVLDTDQSIKMIFSRILLILVSVSVAQGWWSWSWLRLSKKEKDRIEEARKDDERLCLCKPQSDKHLQVGFTLYTQYEKDGKSMTSDIQSIKDSTFNPYLETIFIVHGYTDQGSADWVQKMKNAFLKLHNVNVICVNWQKGADSLIYALSAANTRRVGQIVGDLIRFLTENTNAEFERFHLIGHSLGAHICGFAGKHLNGAVGRITGLDPAGPCFRFSGPEDRLCPDDAKFVEAIHTDGDLLCQGGFGTKLPMGDADFYPNGGEKQPGCDFWFPQHVVSFLKGWFRGLTESLACSHVRVLELFTESINETNSFMAYPCDLDNDYKECKSCASKGCSRMGYYADLSKYGTFALRTKKISPFSDDY